MKDIPIQVRLEPGDRERLEKIAAAVHLEKSTLIRIAVNALVDLAERNGGKIELPLDLPLPKRPKK